MNTDTELPAVPHELARRIEQQARATEEYRRRAEQLGVEYFLNKSLDFERLPEVIRTLARSAHS